jgi:hypothetical protein
MFQVDYVRPLRITSIDKKTKVQPILEIYAQTETVGWEREKKIYYGYYETDESVLTDSSEIASASKHFRPTHSNSSLGRDFSLPNQSMGDLRLTHQ